MYCLQKSYLSNCSFICTLFDNRLICGSVSTNYTNTLISGFIYTKARIIAGIVTIERVFVHLRHKMGNSKSKKVKISDEQTQNVQKNTEPNNERINTLKTEIPDTSMSKPGEYEGGDSKDRDNASSASTVEVLDDK